MHSLAPYSIRCFNPKSRGNPEQSYLALDKVGAYDTFKLLKDFITSKKSDLHILEASKQVYRFENFKFDTQNRKLHGWFHLGHYGSKSDIVNVKTGKVDYEKTQENAEIIKHFIHISLPLSKDEGVVLLHMFRGNGIKTVFYDLFRKYFFKRTTFNLQMNPLSYHKALLEWENANVKEIRLIKFKGLSDVADRIKMLGHDEQTLTFKAPRKGFLGKFKDYLNENSDQSEAVEFLSPLCSKVKTVVELNGRKRIFSVGVNATNTICEIEQSDSLELESGNPKYSSILQWCSEISDEFIESFYGKRG